MESHVLICFILFDAGFRSRVKYISVLDPTNMSYYVSEILDAGLAGPLFMVITNLKTLSAITSSLQHLFIFLPFLIILKKRNCYLMASALSHAIRKR